MTAKTIIEEAISLPVEERAFVIDSLLQSMNSPSADFENEWKEVALQRLQELRSKKCEAVSGDKVFERLWKRYE